MKSSLTLKVNGLHGTGTIDHVIIRLLRTREIVAVKEVKRNDITKAIVQCAVQLESIVNNSMHRKRKADELGEE